MQSFIIALLICSVSMSVLALFYMAITPLLARRYSEKGRYYAWLIIVVGLIIPFRPQFDYAIVKVDMPSEVMAPIIQIGNGTPVAVPDVNPVLPPAEPSILWWQIIAAVWLAGMMAFLAYHAIKHYHFVKITGRWSKQITDGQPLSTLRRLNSEMDISKHIDLYLCPCVGSPMMTGFVKPRILLPKADFVQDELCFILKHELVHYKRKDLLYKYLILAATAIHWFNPIVYLMAKAIATECELSCDAEVVRSTDADTRQHYSETIIGVVKYQSKLKTALSTNFYGGKKGMKKRIFSIMDTRRKKAGIAIICAALVVTIGTGFTFAAQAKQIDMSIEQLDRQLNEQGKNDDSRSMISRVDEETGQTFYSWDNGQTWTPLTDKEYEAMFPSPDIEWWNYEEYKAWLDNEKMQLQDMIGEKGWNPSEGWYTFTQEHYDARIALYEETLQEIKNGIVVSKAVNGSTDSIISYDPKDIEAGTGGHAYTLTISLENGEEISFGPYETKEEILSKATPYCEAQVKAGNMTQSEFDEILSKYKD